MESEGFVDLRQECLYELLTKDDLQVESELQLFQAVLRFLNATYAVKFRYVAYLTCEYF